MFDITEILKSKIATLESAAKKNKNEIAVLHGVITDGRKCEFELLAMHFESLNEFIFPCAPGSAEITRLFAISLENKNV